MADPIHVYTLTPTFCAEQTEPTAFRITIGSDRTDALSPTTCYTVPSLSRGTILTSQVRPADGDTWSPIVHTYEIVPEPSAGLLLVAGLVGLALIGRRRYG